LLALVAPVKTMLLTPGREGLTRVIGEIDERTAVRCAPNVLEGGVGLDTPSPRSALGNHHEARRSRLQHDIRAGAAASDRTRMPVWSPAEGAAPAGSSELRRPPGSRAAAPVGTVFDDDREVSFELHVLGRAEPVLEGGRALIAVCATSAANPESAAVSINTEQKRLVGANTTDRRRTREMRNPDIHPPLVSETAY
jgi:hypothetical protein